MLLPVKFIKEKAGARKGGRFEREGRKRVE